MTLQHINRSVSQVEERMKKKTDETGENIGVRTRIHRFVGVDGVVTISMMHDDGRWDLLTGAECFQLRDLGISFEIRLRRAKRAYCFTPARREHIGVHLLPMTQPQVDLLTDVKSVEVRKRAVEATDLTEHSRRRTGTTDKADLLPPRQITQDLIPRTSNILRQFRKIKLVDFG